MAVYGAFLAFRASSVYGTLDFVISLLASFFSLEMATGL